MSKKCDGLKRFLERKYVIDQRFLIERDDLCCRMNLTKVTLESKSTRNSNSNCPKSLRRPLHGARSHFRRKRGRSNLSFLV